MLNSKKALWAKPVLDMTLVVVVLVVLVFLFAKPTSLFANQFSKCSSSGGYWSDKVVAGDYEARNRLVPSRKLDNGTVEYCYVAIPGFEQEFAKLHAEEIKKSASEETKKKTKTDSINGYHGELPALALNEKIKSFQSTDNPNKYMEDMNVLTLFSSDSNTLKILQDPKKVKKCKLSIRPSKIYTDSDGVKKLKQVSGLGTNPSLVIVKNPTDCQEEFVVSSDELSKLKSLKTTEYKNPGFYKLDYQYWFKEKGDAPDGVRIAYFEILKGSSQEEGETQEEEFQKPTKITISQIDSSRYNYKICYFKVDRDGDETHFPLVLQLGNELISTSTTKHVKLSRERQTLNLKASIKINDTYSLTKTKDFTFKDCNEVVYNPSKSYFDCEISNDHCNTYDKQSCMKDMTLRDDCDKLFLNCNWHQAIPIGNCQSCQTIHSCKDYEKKADCKINQCSGESSFDDRCFYDGTCKTCNFDSSQDTCSQYTSKSLCEQDPCNYRSFENSDCTWSGNACSSN